VPTLASFFPVIHGWLEGIFIGLLALLVALVGLFALYLIVNQFRNPARRPGSPGSRT
jgi:hypothetical protein